MIDISKPRFGLGRLVATPTVLQLLEGAGQTPAEFLDRHVRGDWGDLSEGDCEANEVALRDGSRILSAYATNGGHKYWIITEAADGNGRRAATTILMPDEY